MLRITVTLLPASGGPAREIGRLDIHNEDTGTIHNEDTGTIHNEDTGTRARGNYVARLIGAADVLATVAERLAAAAIGGRRAEVHQMLIALEAATVAYNEARGR